ncbi:hypothetical protein CHS0354_026133 [Potamilus streckersoni]|uniref:Arrestin C-terminal-like domain-containing protein n=1 Tax=Potamilus streckersoni TaxID=2493646 RepID=A0AAE0S1M6_9BIVA|nr:hypothetical protein CHS0354_026133 [Potamilus streckersoni]
MPKLERLEIVLEPHQMVYLAGQCVQGKLVIVLNASMKMRGVRIRFRGRAHVYWEEGSGDSKRVYSASEEYFEQTVVVFGRAPQETNDTLVLPAGQHIFPFNFTLPHGLPSSFEGKYECYVRYWVEGIIDKPWKFDPRVKMPFTVLTFLDLNQEPDALSSAQAQDSKTVCCCCCESGPVTCVFRIDRIGYVPGESIVCNAEITNNCNRVIWSSKVKLYMEITYRTHGGSKRREIKEIAKLEKGQIPEGGSEIWSGERILIPPLPPSFLRGCSIITIDYYLMLKVDVADTPFDLELPLKIIIGTIPIQSVFQQYNRSVQPVGAPVQEFPPITTQPGLGMPTLPPPTYQESVFGKSSIRDNDDEHTYGDLNYAPAYTYYNWT